jgi:prevent-host-death family protein
MDGLIETLDIDRPKDDTLTNVGQGVAMEPVVNLYEAKTHLSDLVERAARGEEIVIAKAGRPLARLVSLAQRTSLRPLGLYADQITIGPDFDAPLPEGFTLALTDPAS